MPVELAIVMPVYNEQASIRRVVEEWFPEVESRTGNFVFICLDDGSTDGTARILASLAERRGDRMEIFHHANRGHGQTCLRGYRIACERGIPHILQIDSDGQCDPRYFGRFWAMRHEAEVVSGIRRRREDGWRRKVCSLALRGSLLVAAGVHCADANVPYRLMSTARLGGEVAKIPETFFLGNVALSVLLRRAGWRHAHVAIRFRERYGGEPSVRIGDFYSRAVELHRQLRLLPS